jgi:hypothetical protein
MSRINLSLRVLAVGLVGVLLAVLVRRLAGGSVEAAPGCPAPGFVLQRIDEPGRPARTHAGAQANLLADRSPL